MGRGGGGGRALRNLKGIKATTYDNETWRENSVSKIVSFALCKMGQSHHRMCELNPKLSPLGQ